jgi:hypothetical protein
MREPAEIHRAATENVIDVVGMERLYLRVRRLERLD